MRLLKKICGNEISMQQKQISVHPRTYDFSNLQDKISLYLKISCPQGSLSNVMMVLLDCLILFRIGLMYPMLRTL